ncbi:MAG: flagellar biosynthetic protein FliO [Myxococcales bacterium]|nr:flagellar biosynthetic protein FliO [Myxococcales bacterium]
MTAAPAEAQVVDAATDYSQVARRYYHRRRHTHHSTPTVAAPAPVAAPARTAVVAPVAPARTAVVAPVAPVARVVAPAPVAPVAARTTAPAPVAAPSPSPVVARPEVAPAAVAAPATAPAPSAPVTATPLPVRPSRPLVMAAERGYEGGGWKVLLGFAGLGLAFMLWKRRAPVSSLATGCEIQVVTRASLGGRSELLVVDVGGQRMLLGVTSGSVQYLAAIDGAEAALPGDPDKTAGFESMFAAARSRTREKAPLDPRDRSRDPLPERPREASRPTLNTQSLRADAPARRSSAPEGQVAGLLALGAYR